MITRIEISGFKTFTDFVVDLSPFTVIAGANASGKSNLFDALQLLSDLANQKDIFPDFRFRGGLAEAFTKYNKTAKAHEMKIAVELLLPKQYTFGGKVYKLQYNRLRYEVAVAEQVYENESKSLHIFAEKLFTISLTQDAWINKHLTPKQIKEIVLSNPEDAIFFIKDDAYYPSAPNKMMGNRSSNETQAIISEPFLKSNPHTLIVSQYLKGISNIDLKAAGNFSNYQTANHDYSNFNPILRELKNANNVTSNKDLINDRVRRIIKDIEEISTFTDPFNRTSLTVIDSLGRVSIADNLSEGTLRIIALSALLVKFSNYGTTLIEEPENGVDPRVMNEVLELLLDLTTNLETQYNNLNQVICTTHSPTLLQSALKRQQTRSGISVLLATKVTALINIDGQRRKLPVTRMNEVVIEDDSGESQVPLQRYTLHQALDYLNRLELPDLLKESKPNA